MRDLQKEIKIKLEIITRLEDLIKFIEDNLKKEGEK